MLIGNIKCNLFYKEYDTRLNMVFLRSFKKYVFSKVELIQKKERKKKKISLTIFCSYEYTTIRRNIICRENELFYRHLQLPQQAKGSPSSSI